MAAQIDRARLFEELQREVKVELILFWQAENGC
jgi:hypothetical protein